MPLNLIRNSRVFFTTNVDSTTGVINAPTTAAFTASNTFEIQVLDGFSFSQNTNTETVTLNEAGNTPVRGQRTFNTGLAPVDFSMTTYIRPRTTTVGSAPVQAEESLLWNALLSDTAIGTATSITGVTGVTMTNAGVVTIAGTSMTNLPVVGDIINLTGIATTTPAGHQKYLNSTGTVLTSTAASITVQLNNHPSTAVTATTLVTASTVRYSKWAWNESNNSFSQATTGLSDKNQLQKFGLLFLVDNTLYGIDNCAMNQVTIDFGLDQIATAQWTGQATAMRKLSDVVTAAVGTGDGTSTAFSGGTNSDIGSSGAFRCKYSDSNTKFITNKLTTASLTAVKAIGSVISAGDAYTIAITGGSITINNNITYITPAVLNTINAPITYYTGTRAITGTLNAYLRTGGTRDTGELLADLVASTVVEPMFAANISIGGASGPRLELEMQTATLGIPAVNTEQVVSTTMNFTAQGSSIVATTTNNTFDVLKPSDLMLRYYAG